MKKVPYITLSICALSLVFQFFPNLIAFFEWESSNIRQGEIWRIFSGHLTHWTPNHLVWDLIVFAFLGSIIERSSRSIILALFLATSILSHFALTYASDFQIYRGLSAIDTALFTQALFILSKNSLHRYSFTLLAASIFGYIALIVKLLLEYGQEEPIFASSLGSNVSVATVTHIAGLVSALLIQAFYIIYKLEKKTPDRAY